MHCHSCEMILEKTIAKLANVTKVKAHQKTGLLEIYYEKQEPDIHKIYAIVNENGYQTGKPQALPWINTNMDDYVELGISGMVIVLLYFILQIV